MDPPPQVRQYHAAFPENETELVISSHFGPKPERKERTRIRRNQDPRMFLGTEMGFNFFKRGRIPIPFSNRGVSLELKNRITRKWEKLFSPF